MAFKAHVKKVEATHMQLASTFDAAATKYEKRFNVNTFLQHYGTNVDGKQTLEMLGDIDLNDEEDPSLPAPGMVEGESSHIVAEDLSHASNGIGLDDDVIEVLTDV